MRPLVLGIATAMLTITAAAAQTMGPAPSQPSGRTDGVAAASGNDNQAVATTAANAPAPAHGHNSFTRGEAGRRIAARGFTNVHDLRKDGDGVWRGAADRNGGPTTVWLDYKGNVGNSANAE